MIQSSHSACSSRRSLVNPVDVIHSDQFIISCLLGHQNKDLSVSRIYSFFQHFLWNKPLRSGGILVEEVARETAVGDGCFRGDWVTRADAPLLVSLGFEHVSLTSLPVAGVWASWLGDDGGG